MIEKIKYEDFKSAIYETIGEFVQGGGTSDDVPMQNWAGNMLGIGEDLGFFMNLLGDVLAGENSVCDMFRDLLAGYDKRVKN